MVGIKGDNLSDFNNRVFEYTIYQKRVTPESESLTPIQ